jgi:hypothetical protein
MLLLLVLLIVIMVAGLPTWGWHPYSYYPSGILSVLVIVLIIFLLMGRL